MKTLTFPVIAEAHLGLSQTNGVLPLADAIEFLQFFLVDALSRELELSPTLSARSTARRIQVTYLAREVDLNGLNANVLGTSRHGGGEKGGLLDTETFCVGKGNITLQRHRTKGL